MRIFSVSFAKVHIAIQKSDSNYEIGVFFCCWSSPLCSMCCYFKYHSEFLIRKMSIKMSWLFLYQICFFYIFSSVSTCRHNWDQKINLYSFLLVFSNNVVLHLSHWTDKELNPFFSIAEQLHCTNRHRRELLALSLCQIFLSVNMTLYNAGKI